MNRKQARQYKEYRTMEAVQRLHRRTLSRLKAIDVELDALADQVADELVSERDAEEPAAWFTRMAGKLREALYGRRSG